MSSRRKKTSDDQNDDQRQFWQMAVETWQVSDLSVRQFCKQEGLSEPTFYKWRNKLINNIPPHRKNNTNQPPPFIEVAIPDNNPALMELALVSGNALRIPSAADSKTLAVVISILQEAGLC